MTKKRSAKKAGSKTAAKLSNPTEASACPKGGEHEWEQADGGVFCKKCHEPMAKRRKNPGQTAKAKKGRSASASRLSAIDAAAKVLGEAKVPMNTRAMIEAMSAKGYWTSPGGKTPWATLYFAILAEITNKGKEARFKKTDRGHFTLKA